VSWLENLLTPTQGAAIMTGFALLSIIAMFLGRETREAPLPR
jgi:hypothetical protein